MEQTITAQIESVKHIDLNRFFRVSFYTSEIDFHGTNTPELKTYCEGFGFEFAHHMDGFIIAKKDKIRIVLSE